MTERLDWDWNRQQSRAEQAASTSRKGVKCGNKRLHGDEVVYHDTVAQVRLCYHRTYGAGVLQDPEPKPEPRPRSGSPAAPDPVAQATPKRQSLAQAFGLSVERSPAPAPAPEPTPAPAAEPEPEPERPRMSKQELRARLTSIPVGAKGKGFFALRREGDEIKFYRVDRSDSGFVSLMAQAGPTFYPVKYQAAVPVLLEIAEHAEEAGTLYASEVGRCWKCNLPLTDETSRALGIGPVCRSREAV